jgi:hypothetical protein
MEKGRTTTSKTISCTSILKNVRISVISSVVVCVYRHNNDPRVLDGDRHLHITDQSSIPNIIVNLVHHRTLLTQFSIRLCEEMYRSTSLGFPTMSFPLYMTPFGGAVAERRGVERTGVEFPDRWGERGVEWYAAGGWVERRTAPPGEIA